MHLKIAYLYPEIMNIYGDFGNIITLKKRCLWRGIKISVTPITLEQKLDESKFDLFFGGGGQDRQQALVAKDLITKKQSLIKAVANHKVFLLICGTYQLFGHYFQTFDGNKIPGLGILDTITIASKKRKIGNVLVLLDKKYSLSCHNLIGFENHSGNTFITNKNNSQATKPLGKIKAGFGNNGQDKTAGAVFDNVFGTYLHGPLLPKNPHWADFLIQKALENRYQQKIKLKPLDDQLEKKAHQWVLKNRL